MPTWMKSRWITPISVVLTALIAGFGDIMREANGDAMLTPVMSIERVTPWLWGNDHRFGMLVPWLTSWCSTPVLALCCQATLTVGAALAAMILICDYLYLPRHVPFFAAMVWLGTVDRHLMMNWISPAQSWSTATCLGVLGMMVATQWAIPLLALAFYVNSGIGLVLVPLWFAEKGEGAIGPWSFFRAGTFSVWQHLRWGSQRLGLVLVFQGAAIIYLHAVTEEPRYLQVVPLIQWPHALGWAIYRIATESGWWWLASLGLMVVVGILTQSRRLAAAGVLVLLAVASLVPAALNAWTEANEEDPRYTVMAMVFLTLAAAAVLPDRHWPRWMPWVQLPIMALLAFGWPSTSVARAILMRNAPHAAEIDAAGCEVLSLPYWQLWPHVIAVLQLRTERGDPRPIYGYGAHANLDLIREHPDAMPCQGIGP